jgi:hypothetical protein
MREQRLQAKLRGDGHGRHEVLLGLLALTGAGVQGHGQNPAGVGLSTALLVRRGAL